jgi:cell division protein FtsN
MRREKCNPGYYENETQGMKQQRGGTFLGFIIGVVVGLACALAVAVYVTKVPVPFMNKGQTRSADQDLEEAKKNKDWDPNAPLYGKNPVKPPQPAVSAPVAVPGVAPAAAPSSAAAAKPDAKADSKAADAKKTETKAAASADPIGELAKAKTAAAEGEPFVYWVQVGAYRTQEDAESQRAKLSLSGIETKISEREQSGRTVFRVRVGPFDKKEEGEKTKDKLDKAGLETALVRVQR